MPCRRAAVSWLRPEADMNPATDRTADIQARLAMTLRIASRSAGILHLGGALAGEVVDVVERMHGTIASRPLPFSRSFSHPTRGITGIIYRGIRGVFGQVAEALGGVSRQMHTWTGEDEAPAWVVTRGILNGVFGDSLHAGDNPLAQPMQKVAEQGPDDADTLVLFLHGLCMSEQGWWRGSFPEFEQWCLENLGARLAHVRYNSGRHISENGRELAALLEAEIDQYPVKRVILIGHSMGGLVIRSACDYGRSFSWPGRVSDIIMLGTPHQGAPLERLGNFANGLLKHSPYTFPLSHLGDLRSAGIKDLRHANLIDEDWIDRDQDDPLPPRRPALPLLDHVDYLLIAATRSQAIPDQVWRCRDDLLVPVASGLALNRRGEPQLNHPRLRRESIANCDHLAIMGHPAAMAILQGQLGRR